MINQKWKYRPDVVAETMEGVGSELYGALWKLVVAREAKKIAWSEMAYWVMRDQLRDQYGASPDAINQLREVIERDQDEIRSRVGGDW